MQSHDNIVPLKGAAMPPNRATAESVLGETASLSRKFLQPLMKSLFDKADNTLFDMAEKAENNAQQAHYFDTMRELRMLRSEIEESFNRAMERAFEQAFTPAGSNPTPVAFDMESLSLVDDDNLEESLALKRMAEKIRNHEQKSIEALDKRFAHLLSMEEDSSHPISPETLCDAFADALKVMDAEVPIRLIIYKLFDLNVISNLGPFYQAVNELMVQAGILPDLPKPRLNKTPHSSPAPRSEAANHSERNETHSDSDPESSLLNALQTLLGSPSGSGLVPIQPGTAVQGEGAMSAVEPAQLLTGLTGLQQSDETTSGTPIDSNTIKNMLATTLQGTSPDTVVGFQHRESLLIDVVAMLFDFILRDRSIPDIARAQIGRLQIPLVKAALIDETFLAKKAHPARQLLNLLAEQSSSLDTSIDAESPMLGEITRVVETITNEFESDISLFQRELEKLEQFIATQRQEEQQLQGVITDIKSRRENEELTRARVDEVIRLKLSMGEAPEPVREIVSKSWRKVLLHTGRTHGTDSEQWQQRSDFVSQLLDSLQPREEKEDRRRLLQAIPRLVATLRDGMAEAGFSGEAVTQTLKVIEPMHMAIVSPSGSGEGTEEALRQRAIENAINDMQEEMANLDEMLENLDGSLLDPEPIGEDIHSLIPEELIEDVVLATEEIAVPDDIPDDEYITTVRGMEVGQVVILHDRDDNPVRCKLSWKSELLGEYVFTNWRHKVVAERTLHGLAGELYQGRLELVDQAPILERALEKVLGGLRQQQDSGEMLPDGLPA